MKHTDETLQAAIDAAMIELGNTHFRTNLNLIKDSTYWGAEPRSRLALAKAFLAKLPAGLQASEADKALADLASRLANIAYDPVQPMAFAKSVADHVDDLREDINHAQKVSLADASATDATIARLNAELAALKSSPIGNLRPLSEAADPYARLKAYAKAGARIRFEDSSGWGEWAADEDWGWCFPPENYQVHPDDLRMVPEYAPVNEQHKQQVPLGLEEKLQAIKDILEIK